MANSIVRLPTGYFPDPDTSRPLFFAKIYIGEPDLDPKIPANQKTVTGRREDGVEVTLAQPIRTNRGGVPVDGTDGAGNVVTLLVDGAYSMTVDDRKDAQKYNFANVLDGAPVLFGDNPVFCRDVIATAVADLSLTEGVCVQTTGYATQNDGGGASYIVGSGGVADGVLIIDMDNGLQLERLPIPTQVFEFLNDAVSAPWLGIGDEVQTKKYSSTVSGGGAFYSVVASSTGVADGGSYINLVNGNQLEVISSGTVSLKQFGCVPDGVTNNTTQLQAIIDYASSNDINITDDGGLYATNALEWKSNTRLKGASFESSKFVNLGTTGVGGSVILTTSEPIENFAIEDFDPAGRFIIPVKSGSDSDKIKLGGASATSETLNSYWHTWRRSDARGVDVFNGVNPTFGDPNSYEGTGGLRVYHSDAWYVQIFGNQGAAAITKTLNNGVERKVSRSDYHINYSVTSVTPPPAKFNTTITNATTYNAATCTLTVGPHSLAVNDYVWWDGADYNDGGSGVTIESTYQITSVTATTITVSITADPNFVSWNNFGRITDDPDNTSYEHIHDPSLGTIRRSWIRNGTSGIDLGCRVPESRLGGTITVRIKVKYTSGHNGWFPRIFQNFGQGGTPNTSTTLTGISLDTSNTEIQEFIIYDELPTIEDKTYGIGAFMQYNFVPSVFDPTAELDIYEYSVFEGLNLPRQSDSSFEKEKPIFEKLYNVNRVSFGGPITLGRFYTISTDYSEPMYGDPTVTLLSEVLTSDMTYSSTNLSTSEGFDIAVEADATVNLGRYTAIWESEYKIPTGFVGG